MAKIRFFICLVIVAMDVAAGILGLHAEYAENKASLPCAQRAGPSSRRAFGLALAAAVLLTAAHITTNLVGGCTCVCSMEDLERSSSRNRQLWFACLILSWIDVAVGLPLLIIGMLENTKSRPAPEGPCGGQMLHQHFLSIGGVLCFVHAFLSLLFYGSYVVSVQNKQSTSCGGPDDDEGHLHL